MNYNVYSGRLHFDLVQALSAEQACEIVKKVWKDPRNYTNTSDGTYWARKA